MNASCPISRHRLHWASSQRSRFLLDGDQLHLNDKRVIGTNVAARSQAADLFLALECIATEPTVWQHSCCVRMSVQHGPKRLSDLSELDLVPGRHKLCS
jgi:hypothetical protein